MAFFFKTNKIDICQNDTVGSLSKILVWIKNQNLALKKKEELKEKKQKKQNKNLFSSKS